mgnify:CR=1 FL=1
MACENLLLVKCSDRDGDDVDDLRGEHTAGHLAHIKHRGSHCHGGPIKRSPG